MGLVLYTILAVIIISSSVTAGDHSSLLEKDFPDGPSVTRECLACHEEQGQDFIKTAHWLWKGPTPHVADESKNGGLGKRNLMNNF